MSITLGDLEALLPPEGLYPSGVVVPIRPTIKGRSFFPGGCGLAIGNGQPYPDHPIMLVGQDFDAAPSGVRTSGDWLRLDIKELQRREEKCPTWKGIQRLSDDGLLDLRRAFFTNALLGARVADNSKGRSPGWGEARYEEASLACLEQQIRLLRPTTVVSLGIESTVLLSRRFGLVPLGWDVGDPQWPSADQMKLQFHHQVRLDGSTFAFASCVHPSYQHLNAAKRSWSQRGVSLSGEDAHRAIWLAIREHDASLAGTTITSWA